MTQKVTRTIETAGASDSEVQAAQIAGERIVLNAKGRKERRLVVATLKENLDGVGDFFHPSYGWLRPRGIKENDDPIDGPFRDFELYEPSAAEVTRLERETIEDRQRAKLVEKFLEGEKY